MGQARLKEGVAMVKHELGIDESSYTILFTWVYILNSLFFKKNLCIFIFWLHWVFGALCRLSLVVVSRASLQCCGFLLRWFLLLQNTGSR